MLIYFNLDIKHQYIDSWSNSKYSFSKSVKSSLASENSPSSIPFKKLSFQFTVIILSDKIRIAYNSYRP